jgi:hypothetical protein
MEGYLEKRSSGIFKSYQNRWFARQGNRLVYKEKMEDTEVKLVNTMENCLDVKLMPDDILNRSFEIVFKDRSYRLRAPTTRLCNAWVTNLKV